MSNDKELAIVPRSLPEVQSLAEVLAKSALLPDALRNRVPDVVVSILAGAELGLSPMAAIRGVHVVQGRPVLSADTMVALVLGSGRCEYFQCVEESDGRITYETKRKGAPNAQLASWTAEDSKRAGLDKKDTHRLYPRAMMKARCKAVLARDAYPDVLAGCYSPEEAEDFSPRQPPPPRHTDAIDAEVVEPAEVDADLLAAMAAAESPEALRAAAAPRINGMPKGSPERLAAKAAYDARLAELAKPQESAA